jgi:general secretion pathway protein L
MSEWLVIRLTDVEAEWLVCNTEGQVTVNSHVGDLAEAAPLALSRNVAVIVPATDALATETDAPGKNVAKLAQVVPYALEERVADELERLHFAVGTRSPDSGRVPVVVVARARLDAWLGRLQAAGLAAQAIYSEATLVPTMPGQVIALLAGDSLTLRLPDGPPMVFPALSLRDAFDIALATQTSPVAGLEPAPLGLLLYAGHDEWAAHQHTIDAERERFTGVKVQLLPKGPLTMLAPAAANGEAVNLLQGEHTPASQLAQGWRAWRYAAILAAAVVGLYIGGKFFELSRLNGTETRLDTNIEEAFRAAMPGQQNANDARRRVERRLLEVRSGGGGALLPALAAVANARGGVQNVSVQGFSFREGTLNLRMTAPDAASLDAIGQQLRAQGWNADILGGSASETGYSGQLQVRREGASS